MQRLSVSKSHLKGILSIPSSKSQSHRALIFGAMAEGTSKIHRLLRSPDTEGMITSLEGIGATFTEEKEALIICGTGGKIRKKASTLNVGNSGIALRFLAALVAHSNEAIEITGDYSIQNLRPMSAVINSLRQLGVEAVSTQKKGFAPLTIKGPIKNRSVITDGRDSQPVSALLISSIFAPHPINIEVHSPGELPWVDLTLNWFDRLHIPYTRKGYSHYQVEGNYRYPGFEYTVAADHSSAAFPIAAALITGSPLTLDNISMDEPQGDKRLVYILQEMGAEISVHENQIIIVPHQKLHGISVDINDCIDTITILAVIACFAEGKTTLHNAAVAREKECDRIHSIAIELRKMGAKIEEHSDGLTITQSALHGAHVSSHADQRVAMSLAVAALASEGTTVIDDTECIAKTYPTFVEDFKKIGAQVL